jgi:hypothetical protein
LYADMLLQLHRPAEALSEYQKSLSKEPNRYRSLAGGMRAAAAAHDRKTEAVFKSRLNSLTQNPHA